jgi:hypothetical protein
MLEGGRVMNDRKWGEVLNTTHALYLDWLNDFLSVEGFAAYHMIPEKSAAKIIIKGRTLHNSQFGSVLK